MRGFSYQYKVSDRFVRWRTQSYKARAYAGGTIHLRNEMTGRTLCAQYPEGVEDKDSDLPATCAQCLERAVIVEQSVSRHPTTTRNFIPLRT